MDELKKEVQEEIKKIGNESGLPTYVNEWNASIQDRENCITIYVNNKMTENGFDVQINWSALGSVSTKTARAFKERLDKMITVSESIKVCLSKHNQLKKEAE